jgi:hypothetical protein
MKIIGRIQFNSRERRTLTTAFRSLTICQGENILTPEEKYIIDITANGGDQPTIERLHLISNALTKIGKAIDKDRVEFEGMVAHLKAHPELQVPEVKEGKVALVGNFLTIYEQLVDVRFRQREEISEAQGIISNATSRLLQVEGVRSHGEDEEE